MPPSSSNTGGLSLRRLGRSRCTTLAGGGEGDGSGGLESESREPLGGLEGGGSGGAPGTSRVTLSGSSKEVFRGDVDGAAAG